MRDSFHEGFPGGRSTPDASFNALYNASWIHLKQKAFFSNRKEPMARMVPSTTCISDDQEGRTHGKRDVAAFDRGRRVSITDRIKSKNHTANVRVLAASVPLKVGSTVARNNWHCIHTQKGVTHGHDYHSYKRD
jgi:hypothetical protein